MQEVSKSSVAASSSSQRRLTSLPLVVLMMLLAVAGSACGQKGALLLPGTTGSPSQVGQAEGAASAVGR
jgi:predicted small lipoprotein YifL